MALTCNLSFVLDKVETADIIVAENTKTGNVEASTFLSLIKESGGIFTWILIIIISVAGMYTFHIFYSRSITYWEK